MAAERRLAGIQQHLCVVMTLSRAHSAAEAEPDIDAIVPLAPRPHTAADDLPGSAELGLSREEIEHFKTAGFVVKRGLVDPALCASLVDTCWENAPEPLVRDDPRTWLNVGEAWAKLPPAVTADGKRSYRRLSNPSANSEWRYHALGFQQEFLAATSAHPNVLHMVEALLGGPVKRPTANRGVYSIFPRLDTPVGEHADEETLRKRLNPHIDSHPFQLGGVLYLSETRERSGCNTLWPGSHQTIYPTIAQEHNFVPRETFGAAMRQVRATIQPVEITASAGDAVFFHHRCVHSTGINTNPTSVRHAVIMDFQKLRPPSKLMYLCGGSSLQPDGTLSIWSQSGKRTPLEALESTDGQRMVQCPWPDDTLEYGPTNAPPNDMFEHWNLGRRPVTGDVVADEPWWVRHNCAIPTPDRPISEV